MLDETQVMGSKLKNRHFFTHAMAKHTNIFTSAYYSTVLNMTTFWELCRIFSQLNTFLRTLKMFFGQTNTVSHRKITIFLIYEKTRSLGALNDTLNKEVKFRILTN